MGKKKTMVWLGNTFNHHEATVLDALLRGVLVGKIPAGISGTKAFASLSKKAMKMKRAADERLAVLAAGEDHGR